MRLWRLRWALKQLLNLKNYKNQNNTLLNPHAYYYALFAKFINHWHTQPIILKLKTGESIEIIEFMSLYIYQEIFIDGCYDLDLHGKQPYIIDVGANTGLFSLRMKYLYPDSNITCYEPYPPNFEKLEQTVQRNQLNDVQVKMEAVSDKMGKIQLYIHPKNIGGHSLYQQEAGKKSIEVDTVVLHDILHKKQCDLLKLDCEGAEYDIIQSITPALAQQIKNIIYEATPACYNVKKLNQYLNDLGYSVYKSRGLYIAQLI